MVNKLAFKMKEIEYTWFRQNWEASIGFKKHLAFRHYFLELGSELLYSALELYTETFFIRFFPLSTIDMQFVLT